MCLRKRISSVVEDTRPMRSSARRGCTRTGGARVVESSTRTVGRMTCERCDRCRVERLLRLLAGNRTPRNTFSSLTPRTPSSNLHATAAQSACIDRRAAGRFGARLHRAAAMPATRELYTAVAQEAGMLIAGWDYMLIAGSCGHAVASTSSSIKCPKTRHYARKRDQRQQLGASSG